MAYQQDDLLSFNRNYILLTGCFTFLFTLGIIYFLIVSSRPVYEEEKIVKKTDQTIPMADLTKYNQDSDKDLIPNFVEDEAILNTYLSEIDYCKAANPICSSETFSENNFISIIIDGSTSMNVPAEGGRTKIQKIKDVMIGYLNDTIREKYVQTQIVGFGNKGNASFIADNESCVANLSFKNFDQKLISSNLSEEVLKNYVSNGKSPIGYTLEKVEKSFTDKNANNIVFIVTDGNDDCGADLNYTFKQVLNRGIIKQINVLAYFAPQDENAKLREAAEGNGGKFSDSTAVYETLVGWKKDFLYNKWCKSMDQERVYQCLDKNYTSAYSVLDNLINPGTPQNEINKIKEIKSSSDLLIQNFRNSETKILKDEFNEIYNKSLRN